MRYLITLGQREIVVDVDDGAGTTPRLKVDSVPLGLEILSVDPLVLRTDDGRIVDVVAEPASPPGRARTAAPLGLSLSRQSPARSVTFSAAGFRGEALVTAPARGASRAPSTRDAAGPAPSSGARASASGVLVSPMPGRISRVLTQVGATVARGAPLLVVEAMKMENELLSPESGTVSEVRVRAGDTVEAGAVLVIVV